MTRPSSDPSAGRRTCLLPVGSVSAHGLPAVEVQARGVAAVAAARHGTVPDALELQRCG